MGECICKRGFFSEGISRILEVYPAFPRKKNCNVRPGFSHFGRKTYKRRENFVWKANSTGPTKLAT